MKNDLENALASAFFSIFDASDKDKIRSLFMEKLKGEPAQNDDEIAQNDDEIAQNDDEIPYEIDFNIWGLSRRGTAVIPKLPDLHGAHTKSGNFRVRKNQTEELDKHEETLIRLHGKSVSDGYSVDLDNNYELISPETKKEEPKKTRARKQPSETVRSRKKTDEDIGENRKKCNKLIREFEKFDISYERVCEQLKLDERFGDLPFGSMSEEDAETVYQELSNHLKEFENLQETIDDYKALITDKKYKDVVTELEKNQHADELEKCFFDGPELKNVNFEDVQDIRIDVHKNFKGWQEWLEEQL